MSQRSKSYDHYLSPCLDCSAITILDAAGQCHQCSHQAYLDTQAELAAITQLIRTAHHLESSHAS